MTSGIATPGGGWRRADGPAALGREKRAERDAAGWDAPGCGRRRAGGGRRGVQLLLRAPDHQAAGVEDPGRAALPIPRRSGGLVGDPGGAGRRHRPPDPDAGVAAGVGGGAIASVGFLIHDLGRPERFLHMLRVLKVTSPLSVGSYILSPFSAAAGATAAVELLGWFPRLKRFGGAVAALFGGPMATYTAVLLANTAVPS